jgi:hypothetical protein
MWTGLDRLDCEDELLFRTKRKAPDFSYRLAVARFHKLNAVLSERDSVR